MFNRPASLVVRLVAVVLALLQSATPGLAAVADGVQSGRAGGRPVVVHVEDRQQPGCAPVHAADCALCQFLTLSAHPVSFGAPFATAVARPAVPRAPDATREPGARSRPGARAPPGR